MTDFRVRHSSWYQIPVVYGWWDLTASGAIGREPVSLGGGPPEGERAR